MEEGSPEFRVRGTEGGRGHVHTAPTKAIRPALDWAVRDSPGHSVERERERRLDPLPPGTTTTPRPDADWVRGFLTPTDELQGTPSCYSKAKGKGRAVQHPEALGGEGRGQGICGLLLQTPPGCRMRMLWKPRVDPTRGTAESY